MKSKKEADLLSRPKGSIQSISFTEKISEEELDEEPTWETNDIIEKPAEHDPSDFSAPCR